jgi:hypothetical protein
MHDVKLHPLLNRSNFQQWSAFAKRYPVSSSAHAVPPRACRYALPDAPPHACRCALPEAIPERCAAPHSRSRYVAPPWAHRCTSPARATSGSRTRRDHCCMPHRLALAVARHLELVTARRPLVPPRARRCALRRFELRHGGERVVASCERVAVEPCWGVQWRSRRHFLQMYHMFELV